MLKFDKLNIGPLDKYIYGDYGQLVGLTQDEANKILKPYNKYIRIVQIDGIGCERKCNYDSSRLNVEMVMRSDYKVVISAIESVG